MRPSCSARGKWWRTSRCACSRWSASLPCLASPSMRRTLRHVSMSGACQVCADHGLNRDVDRLVHAHHRARDRRLKAVDEPTTSRNLLLIEEWVALMCERQLREGSSGSLSCGGVGKRRGKPLQRKKYKGRASLTVILAASAARQDTRLGIARIPRWSRSILRRQSTMSRCS